MINLLVSIVVVGLVVWLFLYLIDYIGIPQPFNKVIKILVMLISVVWLLGVLLPLIGVKF